MAKLVCKASKLECDRYQFQINHSIRPYCDLCDEYAIEDAKHIVMYCPYLPKDRESMYSRIKDLDKISGIVILKTNCNSFHIIMGMMPEHLDLDIALSFLKIAAVAVNKMYITVLKERVGIG